MLARLPSQVGLGRSEDEVVFASAQMTCAASLQEPREGCWLLGIESDLTIRSGGRVLPVAAEWKGALGQFDHDGDGVEYAVTKHVAHDRGAHG